METITRPHGPVWHGATVLLVDDEMPLRHVVRRTLETEGFRVVEAAGGEAALGLIQARPEPFDLVLTDLAMPDIDGRQVSEILSLYRPGVAVLCMSGNPGGVPFVGPSDNPVRVLYKPVSPEDLFHAVRDAITRAADLVAAAEHEVARAETGLSRRAQVLLESRTIRVRTLDLVIAARELRQGSKGIEPV